MLGLRPLHISCVSVGGLSPISISGVYSGERSKRAGSSGSNFVGLGSEPVYVHLVCVDRSLFFVDTAHRELRHRPTTHSYDHHLNRPLLCGINILRPISIK